MATFGVGTAGAYLSGSGLVLPGTAGCCSYSPDSTALSITGDIDIRIRLSLTDWTPAATQVLVSKEHPTTNRSYHFGLFTGGYLYCRLSADGSAFTDATASAVTGLTDGTTNWVRVTWRASDGRVQFFTADGSLTNPSAGDFTQLGTDKTAAVGAIFNATSALTIGARGDAGANDPVNGTVYRAQIRNGLDGTLVYDANFASTAIGLQEFPESSSNAAIVVLLGNSVPVDASDYTEPYFLTPPGANMITVPDSAALDTCRDDFTIVTRVNIPAWTHSSGTLIQGRVTASNYVYIFYVSGSGLTLAQSTDGTTWASYSTASSSVLSANTTYWLKAERRKSDGRVQIFYAADQASIPSSWTQLGGDLTGTTSSLFNGTSQLFVTVGSWFVLPYTVKTYRSLLYSGLLSGGSATIVADVDAAYAKHSTFNERSSNAAVATVTRATSGRKEQLVQCPSIQFDTAKYLTFADDANFDIGASDSFTVAGTFRVWGTPGAIMWLLSKKTGTSAAEVGWALWYDTSRRLNFQIADGTFAPAPQSTALTSGVKNTFVAIRDVSSDVVKLYINGVLVSTTTDTTTATLANAIAVGLGARVSGSLYCDMEWLAGPIFYRSALSENEVMVLTDYLNDESGSDLM